MKYRKSTADYSKFFLKFKKRANNLFLSRNISYKYNEYQLSVINNIIANSKCHIVSLFKDHLIFDDQTEFLRRYYTYPEIFIKLKRILYFFKITSFLFPNYTPLKEAMYIYQNIIEKQFVINKQKNAINKVNINTKKIILNHSYNNQIPNINLDNQNSRNKKKFFDSSIYYDILNSPSSCLSVIFGYDICKENENEDIIELIENIQTAENFVNLKNSQKLKEYKIKQKIQTPNVKLSKKNVIDRNKAQKINQNSSINSLKFKNSNNRNLFNNSLSKLATATNSFISKNYRQKLFKKNNVILTRTQLKETSNILDKNLFSNMSDNEENHVINNVSNKNKIIYHRKVNSSLVGEYLNKNEMTNTGTNQKIDVFNQNIDIFNQNINTLNKNIDIFNQQIDSFNQNISSFKQKIDTFSPVNASNFFKKISPNFKRKLNLHKKDKIFISTKKIRDTFEKNHQNKNNINNTNINITPKNLINPSNIYCNLMHSQTEKYLYFNKKNNAPHSIHKPLYTNTNNRNKKNFMIIQKNSPAIRRNINNELSRMIKSSNNSYFSKTNDIRNDNINFNNEVNDEFKKNIRSTFFKKGTENINKFKMMNSDKKTFSQKFKCVYLPIGMNAPYNKPKASYKESNKNKCCFSSQKIINNF